jgi:HAE1 family hydrophobic/amphiphilic exporter-1
VHRDYDKNKKFNSADIALVRFAGDLPFQRRLWGRLLAYTFQESFSNLLFALALGILVAYMVLASQFNSFLDPLTILMALPFSFYGAFLGLLLMQQTVNMYSMIRMLLLMGIVKKNTILLIDFTNAVSDRGENVLAEQALRETCPLRLRPIIMTSFATMAAAIPSALSSGRG